MNLITYRAAAELLGVKLGTLYSWVSTNRIPHVRFGRRCVKFDPVELAAWIEAHRQPATEEG